MPERFIRPVLIVIAISMLAWIFLWRIFSMMKNTKGIKISFRAEITYFLFYIYIIGVLSLTVFPLPFERFQKPNTPGINVIPFADILKGFSEMFAAPQIFRDYNFQNIVGNIILFIPLGIFLPLVAARYRSLWKATAFACACSVSIELTQLLLRQLDIYRVVDINDVILNTSGAILGYTLFTLLHFKEKPLWFWFQ